MKLSYSCYLGVVWSKSEPKFSMCTGPELAIVVWLVTILCKVHHLGPEKSLDSRVSRVQSGAIWSIKNDLSLPSLLSTN